MLMQTVVAIGASAPTLLQLHSKLTENFDILFTRKATFWNKLIAALIKAFNLREKANSLQTFLRRKESTMASLQKVLNSRKSVLLTKMQFLAL